MKLALQKSLCFKKKKTFSSSEESSMNIAMLEEKKRKFSIPPRSLLLLEGELPLTLSVHTMAV